MAKIGSGSSPRSVLGPWEMDAQGRLPAAGKRNFVVGKGTSEENKDCFGNQEFFEIKGLSESKEFCENFCLLENRGCLENSSVFENKGLSKQFGSLGNDDFFEKSSLFGCQKLLEFENNVFSETNGGYVGLSENNGILEYKVFSEKYGGNEEFSKNKGILENKGFSENTGIFANKCNLENKDFSENAGIFANKCISGSKGITEYKGVSEHKDFSGGQNFFDIKGFSENEAFSRRGSLCVNRGLSGSEEYSGHEGFSESNGFSMKGFQFAGMEADTERINKIDRRRMGVLRGKHVKENIIKVSGDERFPEDKVFSKSGHRFGAAEDGNELRRNGCRKYMGISRVKYGEEDRIGVYRVLAASFGERDGGFWGKRRKKEEEDKDNYSDPLVVLGSDIMLTVLHRLDARSLAQSILVSHGWQALAACDRLWAKKCEQLWLGKAHLPRSAMQRGLPKLAAYSISVRDAKRTRIMKEDLCNHVWEFRFKTPAPLYWLNLDPSWKGTGPPMRRYFHPDGSQTADPTDRVWGGHECTYSIVTFTDQGKIREHYVRINRWPRMSVSRKQDWGWELDNHVYCYSSIPDADKEGGTGPLSPIW